MLFVYIISLLHNVLGPLVHQLIYVHRNKFFSRVFKKFCTASFMTVVQKLFASQHCYYWAETENHPLVSLGYMVNILTLNFCVKNLPSVLGNVGLSIFMQQVHCYLIFGVELVA